MNHESNTQEDYKARVLPELFKTRPTQAFAHQLITSILQNKDLQQIFGITLPWKQKRGRIISINESCLKDDTLVSVEVPGNSTVSRNFCESGNNWKSYILGLILVQCIWTWTQVSSWLGCNEILH